MNSDENTSDMLKINKQIGRAVVFKYPNNEGIIKGILKDRYVVPQSLNIAEVPYWTVVDIIEFEGENEPSISISYFRKIKGKNNKERIVFAGQYSITALISDWKSFFIGAAKQQPEFHKLIKEVNNELRE